MGDENDYIKEPYSLVYHFSTEKAVLVSEDGNKDSGFFLPKSQIEYDPEGLEEGDAVELLVPNWLAEAKGLI